MTFSLGSIMSLVGIAVSGIGALISNFADGKKMEAEIAKQLDERLGSSDEKER